jgi:MFS family permease
LLIYSLNSFLGINELPGEAQSFIRKYALYIAFSSFFWFLSHTFFTLYIIEKMGYTSAGFILSVIVGVQFIFDFPSGALSDYLGQRWVLSIAYISFAIGNILISNAITLQEFIIAMIFFGLGRAQFSGTIDTWFDNNFRIVIKDQDPERKTFGFIMSRSRALFFASSALSFTVGATIASSFSRSVAFQVQALSLIFLIIITLIIVKNINLNKDLDEIGVNKSKANNNYFYIMYKGLKFALTNRKVFFFILGQSLFISSFQVFLFLLYYPILFGYSGNDSLTGLVQSLSYITLIFSGLVVAKLSKRVNTNKLPFLSMFYVGIYFSALIILIILLPLNNTFELIGILVLLFLMITIDGVTGELAVNLLQRVSIDLIPSEIRNSIYSLTPSLVAVLGLIFLPFIGSIVDFYGIIYGILIIEIIGLFGTFLFIFVFDYKKKKDKNGFSDIDMRNY